MSKQIDQRIERLYYARCCGIAIPIMQIGAVFRTAREAMVKEPGISDEALAQVIFDFVNIIAQAA